MKTLYSLRRITLATLLWAGLVTFGWPDTSMAQGPTNTATLGAAAAPKAPPGFERVTGSGNKIDPGPLVIIAYAAFFVCMFGYLIHVVRRQSAISQDMAALQERINRMPPS